MISKDIGATFITFGGILYLTVSNVPKKIETKLLALLLLGDMMHLFTVHMHIDLYQMSYVSKDALTQIIPTTLLAISRIYFLRKI